MVRTENWEKEEMETESQGTTVVDNHTGGRGNSCSRLVKARETERLEKVKVK